VNKRPVTGPVIRGPVTPLHHRYHGRLCGRCLRVTWTPDDVAAGYCGTCHDTTPGAPVAILEDYVEPDALTVLASIRALATP
jgi:hypothetical protein